MLQELIEFRNYKIKQRSDIESDIKSQEDANKYKILVDEIKIINMTIGLIKKEVK